MKKLQFLLLTFCSVLFYGQVSLFADTDKKEIKLGEKLRLKIILETIGSENAQESPIKLPDFSKFEIINTGSEQNTFVEKGNSLIVNQIVYEVLLQAKVSGKIKIGSVLVKVNGEMYKTEAFDIFVKDLPSKEKIATKSKAYLNLETEESSVYQNQPTLILLKYYSKDLNDFHNIGTVKFAQQDNLIIQSVDYEKSDLEQDSKTKVYSQTIAEAVVLPSEVGLIEILPVTVKINDSSANILTSNSVKLNVKNLSTDNHRKIVGNYSSDLQLVNSDELLEVNKPIRVLLSYTGYGNLDVNNFPQIAFSEKYTFYKPDVKTNYKRTKRGLEGSLRATYIVIPKVSGVVDIQSEALSFYNPDSQKFINIGEKNIELNVLSQEQALDRKTTLEEVGEFSNDVLGSVDSNVVKTSKLKVKPQNKLNWKTIITNYSLIGFFFILILCLYWFYKKFFLQDRSKQKTKTGSIKETEEQILKNRAFDYEIYIVYLKKLLSDNRFDDFFLNLESMENDASQFVENKYALNLQDYFQKKISLNNSEFSDYQQLIQTEKYNPNKNSETFIKLIEKAEKLFSLVK